MGPCTEACRARVYCTVCDRPKQPRGRDLAAAAAGGWCNHDCDGYDKEPEPGHLWPGEDLPGVDRG